MSRPMNRLQMLKNSSKRTIENKNDSDYDDAVSQDRELEETIVQNDLVGVSEIHSSEDAEDERMLARLERKRRILCLQREVRELEDNNVSVAVSRPRAIDFHDIEHAVPYFTGDDSYNVKKWVEDYETVVGSLECNERQKLLFARRLLRGTAQMILRTEKVDSWLCLKDILNQQFYRPMSQHEIYCKLSARFWLKDEPLTRYVLSMKEIANQGNVAEIELVNFIINGLRDQSPCIATLYGANTMTTLTELLPQYEARRRGTRTLSQRVNEKDTSQAYKSDVAKPIEKRCYNCSELGHISSNCQKEKRLKGSCFSCHQTGHIYKDCPKKLSSTVVSAAIDAREVQHNWDEQENQEDITQQLDAVNLVSVAFLLNGINRTEYTKIFSLFDTGSPVSFIQQSNVPKNFNCNELKDSNFHGLCDAKLYTYGKIQCLFKFKNKIKMLNVFVIPDKTLPTPILLGRDWLNLFDIYLYNKTNKLNNILKKHVYCNDSVQTCDSNNSALKSQIESNCRKKCITNVNFNNISPYINKFVTIIKENGSNDIIGANCVSSSVAESSILNIPEIFSIDMDQINEELNVGTMLSAKQRSELSKVIKENYCKPTKYTNINNDYEMQIRLTSDVPFHYRPRRQSIWEKTQTTKMVNELLAAGVIRPSDSPYASPIVLVKKRNGDVRMCIDYRTLNKMTIRNNFPLPLIDDCLDYLQGKQFFTVIDLKNGFFHVKMASDSIKYTAFVTTNGQYEYLRMPFGLKNAPAVFQRYINLVFRKYIEKKQIMIYMDDLVIATNDFISHINLLIEILQCATKFGLELNVKKCRFCYNEINYLGYHVNHKGIRPNDDHIRAIRHYPQPINVKTVHSFLGLCSYFRRFVAHFADIARPLNNLIKKNAEFIFDQNCLNAFNMLREKLASSPVLSIYNPSFETELHCDASSAGFGAVLLQRQEDGRFHPVSYFSRTATAEEKKYHSYELETLAIIYALRRFRVYLEGIPFRIITDCNSLVLTMEKKETCSRIARWIFELQHYSYEIQHRSGSRMGHVDALSRNLNHKDELVPEKATESDIIRNTLIAVVDHEDIDFQLQATQNRDEEICRLQEQLEKELMNKYELRDGIVYRRNKEGKLLYYVPKELETNVIRLVHEKIGHLGVNKTYDQIKMHYWFPNMKSKLETFVKNCLRCILYSAPARSNNQNMYNIDKKQIPFHTLHIDHLGPLPSIASKRKHILVITDAFTKHVKLYPVNSTSSKEVCCSLNRYFEYFSRPSRIISDRGSSFTSLEFSSYVAENNIDHVKIAAASPQANGQVERVNRTLLGILSKLSEPIQHADWAKQLLQVEYALNNTIHRSIQTTPSKLLFGVDQKGIIVDKLTEYLDEKDNNECSRNLEKMRNVASKSIRAVQEYNLQRFLTNHKPAEEFEIGEFVVIRNNNTSIGTNKKLIPKFKGPYVIYAKLPHDRYVVRDIEGCQITQIPYDGVIEANRLRRWAKTLN